MVLDDIPAPLPGPRGAALALSGGVWSPCSGHPSRQLLGKAAPDAPSPSHSVFSTGPSPPLLPSLPPSRGGKEGSPALSSQGAGGAPPSVSSAPRFPGVCTGLAPSPEPGGSSPRRAGATRPVSSSLKRPLLPPPPASPPAPASAGSRSPPLGELQTRKQLPPHPGLEPRAARLQVHRNPARASAPFQPRGRGAQARRRCCGSVAPRTLRGIPERSSRSALRAGLAVRCRLDATPGAGQKGKSSLA